MQFGWNIYLVGVDLCCRRTLCYQIIHGYRSEPRSSRGTNARVRYRDLGRDIVSQGRSLKRSVLPRGNDLGVLEGARNVLDGMDRCCMYTFWRAGLTE
jgi:hypothetical protein